jgi:hypothetical protein
MNYSTIVNMGVDDDDYNWEYPMERMVAVWSSSKIST